MKSDWFFYHHHQGWWYSILFLSIICCCFLLYSWTGIYFMWTFRFWISKQFKWYYISPGITSHQTVFSVKIKYLSFKMYHFIKDISYCCIQEYTLLWSLHSSFNLFYFSYNKKTVKLYTHWPSQRSFICLHINKRSLMTKITKVHEVFILSEQVRTHLNWVLCHLESNGFLKSGYCTTVFSSHGLRVHLLYVTHKWSTKTYSVSCLMLYCIYDKMIMVMDNASEIIRREMERHGYKFVSRTASFYSLMKIYNATSNVLHMTRFLWHVYKEKNK